MTLGFICTKCICLNEISLLPDIGGALHLGILCRHGIIQEAAFHDQQSSLEHFFVSRVGNELSSGVSCECQLRNHNTMSNLLKHSQHILCDDAAQQSCWNRMILRRLSSALIVLRHMYWRTLCKTALHLQKH